MSLRYTKPEQCDKASRKYPGYSCVAAPGGGNECEGTGVGGQYSDCKQCLQNCSNNPGYELGSDSKETRSFLTNKFMFRLGVTLGFIVLIFVVIQIMNRKKTEPIYWRR